MHGILLINKPTSWTSFDVVRYIRKISRTPKVGHTGTLDPIAQGLLIICLGNYTKLASSLTNKEKEYIATIRLGEARDTDDVSGTLIPPTKGRYGSPDPHISEKVIKETLQEFVGEILQVPPRYSAIKLKGTPLYKLARKGKTPERKPRKVQIFKIELLSYNSRNSNTRVDESPRSHLLKLKVICSKGTYIRALARDLGEHLGCGGCIESLIRTRIGEFTLSQATEPKSIHTTQELETLLIHDSTITRITINDDK